MHCGKNRCADRQGISAAIARTARSGAATTTGTNWFYRGYTKSRARAGINIVYGYSATGGQKTFFHEKFQGIVFKNLVAVFWLIQSQSQ